MCFLPICQTYAFYILILTFLIEIRGKKRVSIQLGAKKAILVKIKEYWRTAAKNVEFGLSEAVHVPG